MRKMLSFVLMCVCLGACAGNPPAWWNPGNRYGNAQEIASQTKTSAKPAAVVATEEPLDVLDESYEEIAITPMPDEDAESTAGVAQEASEEPLSAQDKLPAPSVLE